MSPFLFETLLGPLGTRLKYPLFPRVQIEILGDDLMQLEQGHWGSRQEDLKTHSSARRLEVLMIRSNRSFDPVSGCSFSAH